MQFRAVRNPRTNAVEPAPVCTNIAGDRSASPSRRLLALAREFGNNAFVQSVSEPSYGDVLDSTVSRIIARWRAP